MNTTYDYTFRLNALTKTMDQTLHRWSKVEPSLAQISNAVKGWQQDVENIRFNSTYDIQTTKNAQLALEEAWHHRDNRHLALKAANDAHTELKSAIKSVEALKDDFIPAYQKKTLGYALKTEAKVEPNALAIKSWIAKANEQLREIELVPQNNRQYIAYNQNLEGHIYNNTAARVKSWLSQNVTNIFDSITPDSQAAIKAIDELVTNIESIASKEYLNRQEKEQIFINVGKAYKMLDRIKLAPRTPAVKADLLVDIDRARHSLDNIMPMLDSGKYEERDLYNEVMRSINEVRSLGNSLPYKALPPDTMKNVQKADAALSMIVTQKRADIRIKALYAAAANIDLIAADVAEASTKDNQLVIREVAAKSFS